MVKKMKAIYYTLNLFNVDVTKKCLIGEGWIPVGDVEVVRNALTEASVSIYLLVFLCEPWIYGFLKAVSKFKFFKQVVDKLTNESKPKI